MSTLIKMQFDPEVAKVVGTDAAIILSNIEFWQTKNEKEESEKHFHDDRYWTFNSHKAWADFFPWLSESQIKRCLKKLSDNEYVEVAQFNTANYDRTNWYSSNRRHDLYDQTISSHQEDEVVQPIPDNKQQIINTDNKQELPEWLDKKTWQTWVEYRKEIKKALKPTTIKLQFKLLEKHQDDHITIIERSMQNGWTGLFPLDKKKEEAPVFINLDDYEIQN